MKKIFALPGPKVPRINWQAQTWLLLQGELEDYCVYALPTGRSPDPPPPQENTRATLGQI